MKVAGPKLPPIGEFIRLLSIDVYGRLDDGLVEGLPAEGQNARQRDSARARPPRRIRPPASGSNSVAARQRRKTSGVGSATPSFSITSDIHARRVRVIEGCREMGRASINGR
jgi:hypothetical protein